MKDLLEAFQIFNKYIPEVKWPTHCEHDVMYVLCDPSIVSEEDKSRLKTLSFDPDRLEKCFRSFWFGSA